jgi:hypothetical protein
MEGRGVELLDPRRESTGEAKPSRPMDCKERFMIAVVLKSGCFRLGSCFAFVVFLRVLRTRFTGAANLLNPFTRTDALFTAFLATTYCSPLTVNSFDHTFGTLFGRW